MRRSLPGGLSTKDLQTVAEASNEVSTVPDPKESTTSNASRANSLKRCNSQPISSRDFHSIVIQPDAQEVELPNMVVDQKHSSFSFNPASTNAGGSEPMRFSTNKQCAIINVFGEVASRAQTTSAMNSVELSSSMGGQGSHEASGRQLVPFGGMAKFLVGGLKSVGMSMSPRPGDRSMRSSQVEPIQPHHCQPHHDRHSVDLFDKIKHTHLPRPSSFDFDQGLRSSGHSMSSQLTADSSHIRQSVESAHSRVGATTKVLPGGHGDKNNASIMPLSGWGTNFRPAQTYANHTFQQAVADVEQEFSSTDERQQCERARKKQFAKTQSQIKTFSDFRDMRIAPLILPFLAEVIASYFYVSVDGEIEWSSAIVVHRIVFCSVAVLVGILISIYGDVTFSRTAVQFLITGGMVASSLMHGQFADGPQTRIVSSFNAWETVFGLFVLAVVVQGNRKICLVHMGLVICAMFHALAETWDVNALEDPELGTYKSEKKIKFHRTTYRKINRFKIYIFNQISSKIVSNFFFIQFKFKILNFDCELGTEPTPRISSLVQ